MGCTNSKVDELPAVCLCRERCGFLDEAIRQRFAFSEAHVAYLHSLKAVGESLDRFFNQDLEAEGSSSPILKLPNQRKGESSPPDSGKVHHLHSHSHSDSGSHLHFHSDDEESEDEDEDGSGSEELHHLHRHDVGGDDDDDIAPPRVQPNPYGGYLPDYSFNVHGGGGGGYMNVSYMKNQTTPSMVYTQRPMSPETMNMGGESSSSSYYYPYPSSNSSSRIPPYLDYNNNKVYDNNTSNGYTPNYGAFPGGYSSQLDGISSPSGASTSKAPPPPPSPPSSSTWDFLNPFESFDRFYPAYTPSRNSREVREEEGIPELEDEEDDDEVVKEVHGDQKFVESSSYPKPSKEEEVADAAGLHYRARPSVGAEADTVEYEVHMVDKKVVDAPGKSKDHASTSGFKPHAGGFKGDPDVVREIQLQFERASESGSDLAKFLEVGKLQYKRKHGGQNVSSKMLHLPLVSSQASIFKSSDSADSAVDMDQEMDLRSKSLSSTLHKLHLWEKKLYEEVKVEEKMRILHERKSKKLKRLDEKGAEAHKVDATRALVRSLSTKIKIAIQVVDKISVKINSLRDDELWPQINDFIKGLAIMWKAMLECHQNQCQAIADAKRLDAIALRKHFSDAHFEATKQLENDIVNWTLRFSYWVGAQKGYVRSLNLWLMKCLYYVPEETPDGIAPFSPGRIGAPPIFVVCHQWSQSLDRVSEKDVVDSMRELAVNVLHLWDRDKVEVRQRMLANKDERKIKILDKEEQKMQKEIQAIGKRAVLYSSDDNGMPLTSHVVYQSETTKGGSLQASLQHVLEAMEKFTSSSLKVYEELLQRIEEDHLG